MQLLCTTVFDDYRLSESKLANFQLTISWCCKLMKFIWNKHGKRSDSFNGKLKKLSEFSTSASILLAALVAARERAPGANDQCLQPETNSGQSKVHVFSAIILITSWEQTHSFLQFGHNWLLLGTTGQTKNLIFFQSVSCSTEHFRSFVFYNYVHSFPCSLFLVPLTNLCCRGVVLINFFQNIYLNHFACRWAWCIKNKTALNLFRVIFVVSASWPVKN